MDGVYGFWARLGHRLCSPPGLLTLSIVNMHKVNKGFCQKKKGWMAFPLSDKRTWSRAWFGFVFWMSEKRTWNVAVKPRNIRADAGGLRVFFENGRCGQLARPGRQSAERSGKGAVRQVAGQNRLVACATQTILDARSKTHPPANCGGRQGSKRIKTFCVTPLAPVPQKVLIRFEVIDDTSGDGHEFLRGLAPPSGCFCYVRFPGGLRRASTTGHSLTSLRRVVGQP